MNLIVGLENLFGHEPAASLGSLSMPCEFLLLGWSTGARLFLNWDELSVKVILWCLEWTPWLLLLR
jgi:hypothetical protein